MVGDAYDGSGEGGSKRLLVEGTVVIAVVITAVITVVITVVIAL